MKTRHTFLVGTFVAVLSALPFAADWPITDPAQNLAGLAPNSLFVIGRNDPFIPLARKNGLLRAIDTHAPRAHVAKLHAGHFKTLVTSSRFQRAMLDIRPTPRPSRWPYSLSGSWDAPVATDVL